MRDYLALVARPEGGYLSFLDKGLVCLTGPETEGDCSVAPRNLANRVMRPDLPSGSPERAAFFGRLRETFCGDWEAAKASLAEANRVAKGDLYFIRCGDAVKIGHTNNIVNRLANMQVNSPHEIDCLLLLKGRGREEKEWHRRFASDRIRGEWFRLSPELEAAVLQEREKYRLALSCSPSDNLSGDGW